MVPEPDPVERASNHVYPVRRRYSLKDDSLSELSDQLADIDAPVSLIEEILTVRLVGAAGVEVEIVGVWRIIEIVAILESAEQPRELQA